MLNDTQSPVTQLFGGTVAEREDMMRLVSPINHVSSDAPPFLIAHGTLDETVPFDQGERFYRALTDAGVEATFIPLEGRTHNWNTDEDYERRLTIPYPPEDGREWEFGRLALPFFQKHLCPH